MDKAKAMEQANEMLEWKRKVQELTTRGFTLESLLDFYALLGTETLMAHFDPQKHTTRDVVRAGIICHSRQGRCALAQVLENGKPNAEVVPWRWTWFVLT